MKINKTNPRHWLLLAQQLLYTLAGAAARPFRTRPPRPLIVLYGHQLSGNLKALYQQWLQTHRDKIDMYFLSLDPDYSQNLKAQGIQVLQCNRLTDMLKVGRCDIMITDHGLHLMLPLLSLTDIKFIDVWHGIPFKGFIPEDFKLQHRYDEVWVSSPLLKKIYIEKYRFPPEVVFDRGYARADKLFRGDPPTESYRAQTGIPKGKKLVLYAPTWQQGHQGHELFPFGESQESFITAVSEACSANNAVLVIRSHLNASISEKNRDDVYYSSMKKFADTESLLQETDLLVCDWSSITFDYLALNRPTIFLDVPPPYRNGFSLGPEYRFGEIVEDMAGLRDQLTSMLSDPGDYRERRDTVHADMTAQIYGENTDGKTAKHQLDRLTKIATWSGQ
jgi:CDP-glycerol glycerophosphotransferase (TagB/SpsB family)